MCDDVWETIAVMEKVLYQINTLIMKNFEVCKNVFLFVVPNCEVHFTYKNGSWLKKEGEEEGQGENYEQLLYFTSLQN